MRTVTVTLALALAAAPLVAQQGGKPLTQDTYDSWRQVQGAQLSPDGQWIAYTLTPVVGDGEAVVRATHAATEFRQPRGWTGRPIVVPNADSGWTAPPVQWSPGSTHALWLAYAPRADFERARREKKPPAAQPKATLAILRVRDGDVVRVPNVKSFRVPRERTGWVAYLL